MISKQELAKISKLQKKLKILELKEGLTKFNEKTNPNYKFLYNAIKDQEYEEYIDEYGEKAFRVIKGFRGVILEGSSRSGKSWSGIDIIIWLCLYVETNCEIIIVRKTYNEFKTTLYNDFKRRLDDFGLDNPFHRSKEVPSFRIGKNTIFFAGTDQGGKFEGAGSDYLFFNEMMHIDRKVYDDLEQRCRKFFWGDYNPSFTEHYVFDNVIPRYDVGFLRTTFKDNPYISPQELVKIRGYEPWLPNSYEIKNSVLFYNGELLTDSNQPPEHPINVEQGTADEFRWKCYGLGLRGAMTGLIYTNIEYIDKFPNIAHSFSLDFGFTVDASALVKYAEDERNIYAELLLYAPTETPQALDLVFKAVGVERDKPIACDSSDRFTSQHRGTVEMVRELREMDWEVFKISKKRGNMYWINSIRSKKVHIVKNHLYHHAKKEAENYRFKEINGISINQPEDKWNHFWDSLKYGHISHNTNKPIEVDWD
ncbi:MAG: phage terminase large subunit [Bacteroidota bacterium]